MVPSSAAGRVLRLLLGNEGGGNACVVGMTRLGLRRDQARLVGDHDRLDPIP
jgi:hypothetical protein